MRLPVWAKAAIIASFLLTVSCTQSPASQRSRTPVLQVRVVRSLPHDADAFCQGLVVENGTVYESTGQYGKSSLRRVDLETGRPTVRRDLGPTYFAEGITILGNRIYQLTWKSRKCIVYDKGKMTALGVLNYAREGWGLANNGKEIFLSDGTSTIRVLAPDTFKVKRRILVKDGRRSIGDLNELEFVDGHILANVWYEDRIAKIDPMTGKVVAWINCSGVYPARTRPSREHVLNGIAYDEAEKKLYVTGKNWPRMYEIEIVDEAPVPPANAAGTEDP
ncbi:MAG: glutaminyl-peptide cyclotransferase [Pirellulaceae bacterium]